MITEARSVCAAQALLGEGPVWDAARQVLWFVDIKRRLLWCHDPADGVNTSFPAPGQIGWALPAEDGLLLCGLQDGLYRFDPATALFSLLCTVPGEPAGNRLNDACTDPWGRVWFGSMDDAESQQSGRFYCFDRGSVTPAGPSGYAITNGPAVDPLHGLIYFTDTLGKRIVVADLTAAGAGDIRPFADCARDFPQAYPDGPVVDAEGCLWTGLYLGSAAARYDARGTLIDRVAMPARDVTKIAFGGVDLMTMFVTTATKDVADDERRNCPLAGHLLAMPSSVRGTVSVPVRW